jgi:hypothetical protein
LELLHPRGAVEKKLIKFIEIKMKFKDKEKAKKFQEKEIV